MDEHTLDEALYFFPGLRKKLEQMLFDNKEPITGRLLLEAQEDSLVRNRIASAIQKYSEEEEILMLAKSLAQSKDAKKQSQFSSACEQLDRYYQILSQESRRAKRHWHIEA